jgi:hypothetical protein
VESKLEILITTEKDYFFVIFLMKRLCFESFGFKSTQLESIQCLNLAKKLEMLLEISVFEHLISRKIIFSQKVPDTSDEARLLHQLYTTESETNKQCDDVTSRTRRPSGKSQRTQTKKQQTDENQNLIKNLSSVNNCISNCEKSGETRLRRKKERS